jgi:predicted O-methyltransferase YrrM
LSNIDNAKKIPGWMTDTELEWLAEHAMESLCIAEIGSWRGRSTRALADNTPGIVFAIDSWSDEAVGIRGWWSEKEDPAKYKQKDWLWWEFQHNLTPFIGKKVIPLRMFSAHAFEVFSRRGMTFDMIFIDGSHDGPHVTGDIQMFSKLLRPGGILSGHDFGEPTCPEVAPAVTALIPDLEIKQTIWRAL